jgi:hypothetical protein
MSAWVGRAVLGKSLPRIARQRVGPSRFLVQELTAE